MSVNKVVYGTTVLVDLTEDTVESKYLVRGKTAHAKDGTLITGTLKTAPLEPCVYDYNIGYIDGARWIWQDPTNTWSDIYIIEEGHTYMLSLGQNVGTRFRAIYTDVDITTITSTTTITGTSVINRNNPAEYTATTFTATISGYLVCAKDNVGKSGIFTYLLDKTEWL